ncbi:MAG: 4-phosphopantetheinyl transferase [Gemmatimonadetes bacterium]|nr:4-phosphopantetheinyl transferase [Gemmatimonadota bacterium]
MDDTLRASLGPGVVHVWRIPLDDQAPASALQPLLSSDERARAARLFSDDLRAQFALAHGWLRRILASYVSVPAHSLQFDIAPGGKPHLALEHAERVEFNLSHSGDVALVAVAAGSAVGVDVERWKPKMEHVRVAERFFSDHERASLREQASRTGDVMTGFYAAWTRKEAYLKARGDGIARGLHHFDVELATGSDARLIADRLDEHAPSRWSMRELAVDDGYSAALVHNGPLRDIMRVDVTATLRP